MVNFIYKAELASDTISWFICQDSSVFYYSTNHSWETIFNCRRVFYCNSLHMSWEKNRYKKTATT